MSLGSLLRRARADLARPAAPVGRDPFLLLAPFVVVALAQASRPGSWVELVGLVPALAAFVAVGTGRRLPWELFAVLVIVPVTAVVGWDGDLEGALFLPVLATLYTSWHLGSTIRASALMVVAAGAPVLIATVLVPEADLVWTPWTAANVFTFSMGLTLRSQRSLIQQLDAAREALADQAVAEERRRIARELHDLAGHTLAAMMLHVTGARHVLERGDTAEAGRALRDAEEVGRSSLDQIRATVAALRTDERGTDPALAGSEEVREVIEAYRRAGLAVDADLGDEVGALTGPLATAVHRIVQEGLANVARHAPGNRACVAVHATADEVVVSVVDHGRPPLGPSGTGQHYGILGMRERARALGGDLTAGAHRDGWRVQATLPRTSAPVGVR